MKKYKILLIEDEPGQALAISTALSNAGYETATAGDGKEGLKKAEAENPDLILLDIVLPKMDGVAVLKELKKKSQTKDIPVIILTNLATGETMRETMEAGSTDYLVKTDYTLEELAGKIKKALK